MKRRLTILSILMATILYGCAIPGVTEPLDSGKDEEVTEEKHYIPDDDTEQNALSDDENVKYEIGEAMPYLGQKSSDINDLDTEVAVTVTGTHLYNGIQDTGIERDKFNDLVTTYPKFDIYPYSYTIDEYKDAKIFMMDVKLEAEEWYLEQAKEYGYDYDFHIGSFQLSYIKDDGSYVSLGEPCYSSKPKDFITGYCGVDFDTNPLELRIGYILDEEMLEVDEIDMSRLIYNVYGGDVFFKYMELFPDE